ncbi:tetratricopeptide repeat protein [Gelidibacter maritimus]|uniref:Tetratricopeptide repeat protein n=1 Tax=Gelidibacter maritimus TaxID=2761487 RepID=A0A7W2R4J3_9FLAO|nr:tetratricopeptide repeat protein [Gelidibacter maritimus]MBA6153160.1 hypothetical protein [Gelidibacter maritimus]
MTINETLIEKYFSKRLTEVELLEFNKRYHTNENFKQEVDFLKNVQAVSKADDDVQFKNQLASYETQISPKKAFAKTKWLKPLIAVAAILIFALGFLFVLNTPSNKDALFSTYFEPSKNVSAPIIRSDANDQLANNAFIAYVETDYQAALSLFEQAFESTKNSELLFYKGNSLLALDKTKEAIEVFKTHLTYSDALTKRTHWYLALAYLKSGQVEKAKQELRIFIDSGETFKLAEAKSLLKKLD